MLSATCERLARWLENHPGPVLVLFSALFLTVSACLGATKLLNFDELFIYYPATQSTWGQTWSFFADGLDTNTPIMALLSRASMQILGAHPLALRLPAILGYWLLCVSLYALVSYRCSNLYGMAAMLLPPVTSVFFYATEARAYGIVLGLAAAALLCWQRATSENRRLLWLLGLSAVLALAVSLHFFAVFLWVPLGLASLLRDWQRRRLDWPLWMALVAALVPLAVFFPMLLRARQNFLGGFWARPQLSDIENTYRFMLTLAFAPLLGTVCVWLLLSLRLSTEPRKARREIPAAEWVLFAGVALLPLFVIPLMLLGGTYVARYLLFTLVGIVLLLTVAAFRVARGRPLFAVVAVLCLGGWFVLKYPAQARRQMAEAGGLQFRPVHPLEAHPWMQAIERSPLPVAISPAVFYLHFHYYSLPEVSQRSYYLTSLPAAMKFDGADTGDRNLLMFERRFPVQVPGYDPFVAQHKEFLLLAETTNPTWVMEKLLADGADLRLILREGAYFLYHVTMP